MTATVTYHCASCNVESEAEVLGIDPAPVARSLDALRGSPGAGPALRDAAPTETMALATRALVAPYLRFAVCPRCGARNPEGLAEERRDRRNINIMTLVLTAALAIGAYFTRWIAIAVIACQLALVVWSLRATRSTRPALTAHVLLYRLLDLAILSAAIAIVIVWPRLSPIVPLLVGVSALRAKSRPGDSPQWIVTAERLSFRDGRTQGHRP